MELTYLSKDDENCYIEHVLNAHFALLLLNYYLACTLLCYSMFAKDFLIGLESLVFSGNVKFLYGLLGHCSKHLYKVGSPIGH